MKYTEAPDKATELINAIEDQLNQERKDKTDARPHVSDLLYCLYKGWRLRRMAEAERLRVTRGDENGRLILLIGQALHTIVAKALGRVANVRLESDWLVGEADARMVVPASSCEVCGGSGGGDEPQMMCLNCLGKGEIDGESFIEEFKTARAGFALDDPIKWPHYVEQIASYIVLSRSMGHEVLKGVMHVLHLTFSSGPRWYEPHPKRRKAETDYEYEDRRQQAISEARITYEQKVADWVLEEGRHSNLRSWPVEFTEYEIEAWTKELKRRADIFMGDTPPSLDENVPADKSGYSWTCQWCPLFVKKGGDCVGSRGRPSNFFPIDRIDLENASSEYNAEIEDID